MKKMNKCFCLLIVGFAQVYGQLEDLTARDYSKMSTAELDTEFILAVQKHHVDKVKELIHAGANVDTPISYTWTSSDCDWTIESTALMYAVTHNYPDLVKVLPTTEGQLNEALALAIKEGYSDVVAELVNEGADINYVNEETNTPLILAIQHARATTEFSQQAQEKAKSRWLQRRQIIQILLNADANINDVNKHGRTALMEAVIKHDLYTVEKILNTSDITTGSFFGFGTKPINYVDNEGNTAIILALKHALYRYINRQEYNICMNTQYIIKALLDTPGIDLSLVNKNGETAITLIEELQRKTNNY